MSGLLNLIGIGLDKAATMPSTSLAASPVANDKSGSLSARLRTAIGSVTTGTKLMTPPQTPSLRKGARNNVKVGVRCRPLSKYELELEQESIVEFTPTEVCLNNPAPAAGEPAQNIFAYDYVYSPEGSVQEVFEDLALPVVEGLFNG